MIPAPRMETMGTAQGYRSKFMAFIIRKKDEEKTEIKLFVE